jgi:hypothetical protein
MNETPTSHTSVNLASTVDVPQTSSQEESKPTMITLDDKKEKKSDEASGVSKFWNWAIQLF